MTVWKRLYALVDWDVLQDEVDELADSLIEREKIDAHVRAYIEKVAKGADLAVDFDLLINGPAEPIGDALEAFDFGVIRGALLLIYTFAKNTKRRLARRLGRLEARLVTNDLDAADRARLAKHIDRLRKRIFAAAAK